jgi:hypothetical protein
MDKDMQAHDWTVAESTELSGKWIQLVFRYNTENVREYKLIRTADKGIIAYKYFTKVDSEINKREAYTAFYDHEALLFGML